MVHLPEPHECPVTQECSHENQEKVKEQQIIQQLNEVLGSSEKDLEIIINRIKELIDKPPLTYTITDEVVEQQLQDAQQTILKLEKELSEKETPFGEDLAVIKKLELNSLEELFKQALDSAVIQQIQQATSYQQVVAARQAFLEKRLESKQNIVQVSNLQTIQQERNQLVKQRNLGLVAAGTLLITGLTTTAILGRKVKQLKAVNKNYHSDYQKIKGELEEIMIKMRGLVEEKRG